MNLENKLLKFFAIVLFFSACTHNSGLSKRFEDAASRTEIMNLSSRFDNGLDSEDADKFVGTFTADGILAGFWGESKGGKEIKSAFDFMLSTFARNRHHVVSNHEIAIHGEKATMFSYLTVFDRATNTTIGTASFRDELVVTHEGWRFKKRTLTADKNVEPILKSLRK